MYTLKDLQDKNLKELKEIGWQLNVQPEGDKRCRQNWIDALIGINPPLLQLLEVPPVETVNSSPINERAIEVQAQEPIETPPGVESTFGRIVYSRPTKPIAPADNSTLGGVNEPNETQTDAKPIRGANTQLHNLCVDATQLDANCGSFQIEHGGNPSSDRLLEATGNSEGDKGRALLDRPDELTAAETPPGVKNFTEADRPPGRGDGKRKTSTAHQLLELFKASAHIIPDSPAREIKSKVSQSAIAPAAKNHLDREEGITLSSTFLARYSPPQPENIHYQADAEGQLSLLDFTVETSNEPPDPDDFPNIDAFNTAMARWDAENAEALAGSLDSMCEWAPCPHEWYEPEADKLPLKASSMSEVMEASPSSSDHSPSSSDHSPDSSDHYEVRKCWNFSIPTFDAWCDRANRQNDRDEPPDTGIGARLPGPKPPKFPPRAIGYTQTNQASRNYPETIPKLFSCIAASSSSRPGRDPPGGDAGS